MNLLFWLLIVVITAGVALHIRVVQQQRDSGPVNSPVEAFSFTHQPNWPLDNDEWSLEDVQFVGTAGRVRAVVTIDNTADEPDRRRQALEVLAHEIYRHTEVEAVYIEARRPDAPPDRYLFAADGRGWWGREILSTAIDGVDLK